MSRSFYVYKIKNGSYKAEFLDPKTGLRLCVRTVKAKSINEATEIAAGWVHNGIPKRQRGRDPVYVKPVTQSTQALAGLAAILKAIENTPDLDQTGAMEIARALKTRGLLRLGTSPMSQGKRDVIGFLKEFWDYDNSLYLKDRRAHGKGITLRTCADNQSTIRRDWEPYFAGKKLAEITRQDLKLFGIALSEEVAGKTVNNRLLVGTKALRWAYLEKMIPEDVTEGLGGFAGGGKKRDILTMEETAKLFDEKYWDDKMAYAAALLAATSGLRSGEIRALKAADIGDVLYSVKTESGETSDLYLLHIRHGWNYKDGLKLPKNNEEGTVHLLPEIRALLLGLLKTNPHDIDDAEKFIFWGIKKDRPCGAQRLLRGLYHAIKEAKIDLAGRKVDLHSFRHLSGTALVKETGDIRKVQKALRHKSVKATQIYIDHEAASDIAETGAIAAKVFSNIIKPPERKGA
jgi:integrase